MAVAPVLEHSPVADKTTEASPIRTSVYAGFARIAGARVHYTFETPENPADIVDPIPISFSNGWMGPEDAYDPLREAVAQLGKPALTYNAARSRGWRRDLDPRSYHWAEVAKFTSQVAWAPLRYVMQEFGFDSADLYGHSLGGQTVVNLALHKPELIRNVLLDSSCGVDLHDLSESWNRSKQFARHEFWPNRAKVLKSCGPNAAKQAAYYIFRNPALTIVEGLNAGSTNLQKRITRLAELGIGVAALQSEKDIFSPGAKVKTDSGHLFATHFYTREHPESGHLAPQLDPSGTAQLIMRALVELQPVETPAPVAA